MKYILDKNIYRYCILPYLKNFPHVKKKRKFDNLIINDIIIVSWFFISIFVTIYALITEFLIPIYISK